MTSFGGIYPFQRMSIDRTANWPTFNREMVRQSIVVPQEAEIIKADELNGFWEMGFNIVFRLPATKSPEAWLAQIAKDSRIEGSKVSDTYYNPGGMQGDPWYLRYHPESGTYEAECVWD